MSLWLSPRAKFIAYAVAVIVLPPASASRSRSPDHGLVRGRNTEYVGVAHVRPTSGNKGVLGPVLWSLRLSLEWVA